ncbi:MAG: bacteriohemerythrin [Xanthomonadales bacterium]|jgi:hemerythrin|nr:bacteriohemerythrin [Xanthomonadales bacterium]
MKELVWDEVLSVENEEIDNDHRILINLFNLLGRSVLSGASREYVELVLEELIRCTAWHFSHEERLMMLSGYGGLEEHRREHMELMQSVRQIQEEILRSGRLEEREFEILEQWLTGHILAADMEFGEYLLNAA